MITLDFGLTTFPGILNKLREAKEEGDTKLRFRMDTGQIEQMFRLFKTIPIVRREDGMIDSTAMFSKLDKGNKEYDSLKAALLLQYEFSPSRYVMMKGGQKENLRWCSLIPYVMFAFKEEYGIEYSEWPKDDNYTKLALGYTLMNILKLKSKTLDIIKNLTLEDIIMLRNNSIKIKGEVQSPLTYRTIQVEGLSWYNDLNAPLRHIVMQSWLANITHRTDDMILDINDWDNIPVTVDTANMVSIRKQESEDYLRL